MREHPVVARAEVCTFVNPAPVTVSGVSAVLRERLGIANAITASHRYLRLTSSDGVVGWSGPFVPPFSGTTTALAEHWKLIGPRPTVASAVGALAPAWDSNPSICAAIETALWDLQCRADRLPLWRVLRPRDLPTSPQFYASALHLGSQHAAVLRDLMTAGYPVVKWTVDPFTDIAGQMSQVGRAGVPWHSIALDAHGHLDPPAARHVYRLAPELAWLEDPFTPDTPWDADELPRIVTGENSCSPGDLARWSRLPGVYAVNLEVDRLGITRACAAIAALRQPCLLHGRALAVSMHLATAFPEMVRAVETHAVYVPERLATICPDEAEFDPRTLWPRVVAEPGCTFAPSPAARLSAREDVLHT